MSSDQILSKLLGQARPLWVMLVAVGILIALFIAPWTLHEIMLREKALQDDLRVTLEQSIAARERVSAHDTLKTLDLEQLKAGLSGNAQSQKSLFESGLSLQEERRLLEKQLEIITTSLFVNPSLQRVFLMRAEQPLQSYLLSYVPLKAYAGAPVTLPGVVRITSKERFAHPERGMSEQIEGFLQWVPPQVGTSLRSKALGEFVMFTNSALILHGAPVNAEDHERFQHACLGLESEAARKLYRASFIGTKISLTNITIEGVPLPLPSELTPGTTP